MKPYYALLIMSLIFVPTLSNLHAEDKGISEWQEQARISTDKKSVLLEMLLVASQEKDGFTQKLLTLQGPEIFYPASSQKEENFQRLVLLSLSLSPLKNLNNIDAIGNLCRTIFYIRGENKSFTQKLKEKFLEIQKWEELSQETKDLLTSLIKTIDLEQAEAKEKLPNPVPAPESPTPVASAPEKEEKFKTLQGPDGKKMVFIPSGDYECKRSNEKNAPIDKDYIPADFWIDQTEVSNTEYVIFLNKLLKKKRVHHPDFNFHEGVGRYIHLLASNILFSSESEYAVAHSYENHPVTGVNWYGANAYATFYGKALPTWSEWRAAAQGPTYRDFPWGSTWDSTKPNWEGSKKSSIYAFEEDVSPFGVLNMTGNVSEWSNTTPASDDDDDKHSVFIVGGNCDSYNKKEIFNIHQSPKWTPKTLECNTYGFRCVLHPKKSDNKVVSTEK